MGSKKTRKEKIHAEARKKNRREKALLDFLRNYGDPESPQDTVEAPFDNQIKSLFPSLAEVINENEAGTVIDVGCGNGAILRRIGDLPLFFEKDEWNYVGVDYPEYKSPVIYLAVDIGLHRKVDFCTLDEFHRQWPNQRHVKRPHLVICRNVLHELDIEKTSTLLFHVANNLAPLEKFILQDLLVFPKAEKGNVCWEADSLAALLEESGFSAVSTVEQSRFGGRWVTIIAKRREVAAKTIEEIKLLVIKQRQTQWEKWKKLGALHREDDKFRDVIVAKIDFDLQYAALNAQLLAVSAKGVSKLQPSEESLVLKETFARALNSFQLIKPKNILEVVESVPYFVNRGNSKNALEKFLVGKEKITLLQGQPLMGKSELAKEVLSKFHHNRFPVLLDVQATSSVWNLVEGILGAIRCNVSSAVLSSLRSTNFSDVKDEILRVLIKYAREVIFVFDHVERLLNPGGLISDSVIRQFLIDLAAMPESKVILTSSKTVDLSFFPPADVYPEPQPPVGRFPEGPPHVAQLLGLLAGIKDCPDTIIKAIDRHPLLAVLTGLCVRKSGVGVLSDDKLVKELKGDLRAALINRISDDASRPAIDAISQLRIPVPRDMLINLSSLNSVKSAEDLGLIYRERDRSRDDLFSCIGAMRFWTDSSEKPEADNEAEVDAEDRLRHGEIARQYQDVYRKDDDPKWLREIYYHKLLSGDEAAISEFGGYYRSEIFGAGEYWFRKKKRFDLALWAFSTAATFGENGAFLRMRLASCLIRTGKRTDGEREFKSLIRDFPKAKQIISSYVDSLIYVNDFKLALKLLEEHHIEFTDSPWHAVQFGRIYMGLHQYHDAIIAFKTHLQFEQPPIAYQNLARAYHKIGDTQKEIETLNQGLELHPESRRLRLAMASLLEKTGDPTAARDTLRQMLQEDPHNGWVMFPLIKALCKCGESEVAIEIFNQYKDKIYPECLRMTIMAETEAIQKHYRDAIDILDGRDQDEHSVGQKLEFFYNWAMDSTDPEERISIAKEGLSLKIGKDITRNVPILLSRGKLAVVADDYDQYMVIKGSISSINPNLTDLDKFAQSLRPDW